MKPYKGYTATFEYNNNVFHGEVAGIQDVITFQSDSKEGLTKAFHESVNDYIDFCKEDGIEPQKPF